MDPLVGKPSGLPERGQLRSIPLLEKLGITHYTFLDSWRQYDLVPYEYVKMAHSIPPEIQYPICQIVSQEVESNSDFDLTRRLLVHALSGKVKFLVLVVDSVLFRLRNNQDGKPMIEDWSLSSRTFRYETTLSRYLHLSGTKNPAISFRETQNLLFHEMAIEYYQSTNKKPRRLADLFDYDVIPEQSGAWRILMDFANKTTKEEFEGHIHNSLRSWVESDVSKIAQNMLSILQRCSFKRQNIETFRHSIRGR